MSDNGVLLTFLLHLNRMSRLFELFNILCKLMLFGIMGTNKCRSHKVMCSNKKLKDQKEIEYIQLQLDII